MSFSGQMPIVSRNVKPISQRQAANITRAQYCIWTFKNGCPKEVLFYSKILSLYASANASYEYCDTTGREYQIKGAILHGQFPSSLYFCV